MAGNDGLDVINDFNGVNDDGITTTDDGVNDEGNNTEKQSIAYTEFPFSKEMDVNVSSPEKHGDHISYLVKTETSLTRFKECSFQVQRRYSEFLWLHSRLEETYPGIIIPPMPAKKVMQHLSRFSNEFTSRRCTSLDTFIRRVCAHPSLSESEDLVLFLEAPAHELSTIRRKTTAILDGWSEIVKSCPSKIVLKNNNENFSKTSIYCSSLNDYMLAMEKISSRISGLCKVLGIDYTEFKPVFSALSTQEDGTLKEALLTISSELENVAESAKELGAAVDADFTEAMREYGLYAQAVKTVVKRRDALQLNGELLNEELSKRRNELEETKTSENKMSFGSLLGKDPETFKQEKINKLTSQIESLESQLGESNATIVRVNASLVEDITLWHETKKKDFKRVLMRFADMQISHHEKNLISWEQMLSSVDAI